MAHKHWPKDHPNYEQAPTCPLLKKDCDALWTAYLHFHEGEPCDKRVLPGNVLATCVKGMSPEKLQARLSKRVQSD